MLINPVSRKPSFQGHVSAPGTIYHETMILTGLPMKFKGRNAKSCREVSARACR